MALPAVIEPCLPSPGEQPPTGPDWVHEIKRDGYRLMARRDALSVGIRFGRLRATAKAVDLLDRKAATVERGLVGNGYK
jgi:ATP-dependent DNA ligase